MKRWMPCRTLIKTCFMCLQQSSIEKTINLSKIFGVCVCVFLCTNTRQGGSKTRGKTWVFNRFFGSGSWQQCCTYSICLTVRYARIWHSYKTNGIFACWCVRVYVSASIRDATNRTKHTEVASRWQREQQQWQQYMPFSLFLRAASLPLKSYRSTQWHGHDECTTRVMTTLETLSLTSLHYRWLNNQP